MPDGRVLLPVLHGMALVLALAAALVWPRPGQAALLVPITGGGMKAALTWAEAERADYLAIDPGRGRIIARIRSNESLMRALGSGIMPVAARGSGCMPLPTPTPTPMPAPTGRLPSWTN